MKIIFMGTPDFSVPALQALIASHEHDVIAVYTQPPRPAGRGHKEQLTPIHHIANEAGIEVLTPVNFKETNDIERFKTFNADVAIVAAYGLLLPKPILDAPQYGCLNIHASILPRWRGAAPIQRAILEGDTETGITIMQMNEGLDTGDILAIETTPIHADTTGQSLHDTLSELGIAPLLDVLEQIENDTITATPQPEDGITYAKKLHKSESLLNWNEPAIYIDRKIRAFTPWPSTHFIYNGENIKVLEADYIAELTGEHAAGTVIDDKLTIACGTEFIRPTRIQRAGKKSAATEDVLRGFAIPTGTKL